MDSKTTQDLVIREMGKSDRDMWAGMYRRLWAKFSDDALFLEIDRVLKSSKRAGYVAEIDGHAAGFAEYAVRDYANGCESQPVPFLEGIWVSDDYRQSGVARRLVEFLETKARNAGFKEFGSDVELTNYASQVMHERLGFQETDRVIFYRKLLRD